MFVNAYVTAKGHTLPTVSSSSFADVETNASYLPQLVYGADRGLLDELITSKRGQLYFSPTAFVTKKNVYNMLRKALDIQFVYDPVQADQQNMTRAEVAELLVESLGLKPAIQKEQSPSNDVTLLNKLQVLLSML